MKSIEHYIREKLNLPDAPAEVDADDLWAGIEINLPAEKEKPKAAPWPWKQLFFTLLFLVIGLLGGWFLLRTPELPTPESSSNLGIVATSSQTQHSSEASGQLNEGIVPSEALPTSTNTSGTSDKNTSSDKESQQLETLSKTSPVPAAAPSPEKAGKPIAPIQVLGAASPNVILPEPAAEAALTTDASELSTATPTNKKDTKTEPAAKSLSTQNNGGAPEEPKQPAIAGAVSLPAEANTTNRSGAPTEEGHQPSPGNEPTTRKTSSAQPELSGAMALIATAKLPMQMLRPLPVPPSSRSTPSATYTPTFRNTLTNRFSFGVNAGANLLFTSYATTSEGPGQALNASVKSATGSSFGFDLRYNISKKIALSTGLEYHRTLNTFEHTIVRNTMIEHPSALNSGPIRAILRHRVADNLRTRFFTVPVLIHWTQSSGRFNFGIGAGVGLNFRQFANGTTLSPAGDFVPFDAANGPSPTPEVFLSYHLSPSVSYRLKPESPLSLEAKADFRYLPFGADALSGLKRNSVLSGLSIGLRYGL